MSMNKQHFLTWLLSYKSDGSLVKFTPDEMEQILDIICELQADNKQLMEQISSGATKKPLLADAKVGDLCQRRDGEWVQIEHCFGFPDRYRTTDSFTHDNEGKAAGCNNQDFDIIATEPLAPEGSAEWAWQMLILQKSVSHPSEGVLQDTYYTKEGFVRCMAKTGWRIYEPEPEPAKEQFKVGDWVEFIDAGGRKSQGKYLSNAYDNTIFVLDITYNMRCVVPTAKIIRKLSPHEVVVHIGCLNGTVAPGCSNTTIMIVPIGYNGFGDVGIIPVAMLDTPTRELVRELIEKQGENNG